MPHRYPHPDVRSTLQFRILAGFTLLAAAAVILFGSFNVITENRTNRIHATEKARLMAALLADAAHLPLSSENRTVLVRLADTMLHEPNICGVEILKSDGMVMVRLPDSLLQDRDDVITVQQEIHSAGVLYPYDHRHANGPEGRADHIGMVRLHRSTDDLRQVSRTLILNTLLVAGSSWLAITLGMYLILRRMTMSFRGLMSGLTLLKEGNYAARIPVISGDESGRAAETVNSLAEALALREEDTRRLTCELEVARYELQELVENLPLGIGFADQAGAVTYLNRFIREHIGHTADKAPTLEAWWRLACPDPGNYQRVKGIRRDSVRLSRARRQGSSYSIIDITCADGTVRKFSFMSLQQAKTSVGILIDMTEHDLLQAQMVRNQRLEDLGILTSGLAHNFNNVLTGIRGYLSYACSIIPPGHTAHGALENAAKTVKRASDMARQLMVYARTDEPVRHEINIRRIIEEALSLSAAVSGITHSVELPDDLALVNGDDGQMFQVFSCLFFNAVQAMPAGGNITVRGRNVSAEKETLPASLSGAYVEVSVRDTGCGIPDEDRAHIFTPYFTTKAEVGTGLGLATAHAIITRHNGVITFTSEVGAGTEFTVYLPAGRC